MCHKLYMEETRNLDSLTARYLTGSISNEDFQTFKELLDESQSNREYVRRAVDIWVAGKTITDRTRYDSYAAYERLLRHAHLQQGQSKSMDRRKLYYFVAAVAMVLLLCLPLGWKWVSEYSGAEEVTLRVPDGSLLKMTMPDGSKLTLNSGSVVVYDQHYGVSNRNIRLDGQGYFEVKHNDRLPFIIKTGSVLVKDLGTKFYLRNYLKDTNVRLRLIEGLVSVQSNNEEMRLNPGERMMISKATGKIYKMITPKAEARKNDLEELVFENSRLSDIAIELSRCYGANIRVAAGSGNKRFYGSFNRREMRLHNVLNAMASTGHVKYKYINNIYILY